jgi:hypothetical protein
MARSRRAKPVELEEVPPQHVACKGARCVVGWDGLARVAPLDDSDRAQIEGDHREHLATVAERKRTKSPQERLDKWLHGSGLTREELKAALDLSE